MINVLDTSCTKSIGPTFVTHLFNSCYLLLEGLGKEIHFLLSFPISLGKQSP